jgi:hypothetical protein
MLVRADEDDWAFDQRNLVDEVVPVIELGRDPQAEDADQLVDRAGRARAAEDHRSVVIAAHAGLDDLAGVLAESGGLQPGAAGPVCVFA